jgi:hypothetical protein
MNSLQRKGAKVGSDQPALSLSTLARRWSVSAEKLRRDFHAGKLKGFQVGGSIRIFASEVERIECPTELVAIEGSLCSSTDSPAFASRLARMTVA